MAHLQREEDVEVRHRQQFGLAHRRNRSAHMTLIERRTGYPGRHQVDLEGADILQFDTIGGQPEYRLNFDTEAR